MLSWPSQLTYSGQFTHINSYPSTSGETDVLPLSYTANNSVHQHRGYVRYVYIRRWLHSQQAN